MKSYSSSATYGTVQKVLGGLGIIGGIWLILAPFVLNYSGITVLDAATKKRVPAELDAVTVSDIITGVLLIVLVGFTMLTASNTAMAKVRFYASLAVIAVGVYLVAAPYLFDLLKVAEYMGLDKPNTNDQLMGILTIILGGYAFETTYLSNESGRAIETTATA